MTACGIANALPEGGRSASPRRRRPTRIRRAVLVWRRKRPSADAYSPNGAAGGAAIVPSKGVIVVRRGIDRGPGFNITQFSADVIAALGL